MVEEVSGWEPRSILNFLYTYAAASRETNVLEPGEPALGILVPEMLKENQSYITDLSSVYRNEGGSLAELNRRGPSSCPKV